MLSKLGLLPECSQSLLISPSCVSPSCPSTLFPCMLWTYTDLHGWQHWEKPCRSHCCCCCCPSCGCYIQDAVILFHLLSWLHDENGPNHENDDDEDDLFLSLDHRFPWKVHLMLEHAENKKKYHDFMSGWRMDLHSRFIRLGYFDQTKYESFHWQLNLYGFTRMSRGEDHSVTSHSSFLKGAQCLCENIRRKLSWQYTMPNCNYVYWHLVLLFSLWPRHYLEYHYGFNYLFQHTAHNNYWCQLV